jgi:hypothetical protein
MGLTYIIDGVTAVIRSILAAGKPTPILLPLEATSNVATCHEFKLLLVAELDTWCKLPNGKVTMGPRVSPSKCIPAITQTLHDIIESVREYEYITLREVRLEDCFLDPDGKVAKHRVLDAIAYTASTLSRQKRISYNGMSTEGDSKFTQLGWNLRKLGIPAVAIENILRDYYL